MSQEYSVKLSITLTNRDMSVLKKALKDYSFVVGAYDKPILNDLLELIENADKRARRQANISK